jgi:flavodoxin
MNSVLLYASRHGRTRKVAAEAAEHLSPRPEVFQVRELEGLDFLGAYELFLFFCPTYGDEELQEDLEYFFLRGDLNLAGKHYAICELGSYYGYDDFSFGAMRILRKLLREKKALELCQPLSLDSFPRTHSGHLLDWVGYVNASLSAYAGSGHH